MQNGEPGSSPSCSPARRGEAESIASGSRRRTDEKKLGENLCVAESRVLPHKWAPARALIRSEWAARKEKILRDSITRRARDPTS